MSDEGSESEDLVVELVFDVPVNGASVKSAGLLFQSLGQLLSIAGQVGALSPDLESSLENLRLQRSRRIARQQEEFDEYRRKISDLGREGARGDKRPPFSEKFEPSTAARDYRVALRRSGVRLITADDVRLLRTNYASPLEIALLVVGGGSGFWAFVQALEKLWTLRTTRERMKIERDIKQVELDDKRLDYEQKLALMGLDQQEQSALSTIRATAITPRSIEVGGELWVVSDE